jgi:hypothetical protein
MKNGESKGKYTPILKDVEKWAAGLVCFVCNNNPVF